MLFEHLEVGMMPTNCYLIADERTKEAAVIDPGDDGEKILAAAEKMGVAIQYILLTHAHFDHILAASPIQEKTGAQLAVHPLDGDFLSVDTVMRRYPAAGYTAPKPDILLSDGDQIKLGELAVQVLHTPGHSPGSCVFLAEDAMFSGDTLFYANCGRCDLQGGSYEEMLRSLKRLSELPVDYRIFPGHMEFSRLSEERKINPYMREGMGLK